MADVKISALPAASGVTADDLIPIVNDPAGSPATQKATAAQLAAYLLGSGGGATAIPEGRLVAGGTTYYSIPGVDITTVATLALVANTVRYEPFLVVTPITLDQLACEVTSSGAGGTTCRMGIYNADSNWQPTTLVLDAGTVTADSNAIKAISVNQTLTPGRYLFAINSDGAPTMRTLVGGSRFLGYQLGANAILNRLTVAQAYGVFPGTGTAIAAPGAGTSAIPHIVACRVGTP